jgi:hypothetical protein
MKTVWICKSSPVQPTFAQYSILEEGYSLPEIPRLLISKESSALTKNNKSMSSKNLFFPQNHSLARLVPSVDRKVTQ